jgi:bacteriorhodopsin
MVSDPGIKAAGYSILMVAAIVALFMWPTVKTRLTRIHQGVLFWSGLVYLGFVFNVAVVEQFGWYLDWTVSTPLMLLAVLLSAGVTNTRKIGLILLAQIGVIATGAVTEATGDLMWFALGSALALIVVYALWDLEWKSREQKLWLGGWITLFWVLYPVLWIIGTPGYEIVGPEITSLLFLIVPAISKIGLAVVDLAAPWADRIN